MVVSRVLSGTASVNTPTAHKPSSFPSSRTMRFLVAGVLVIAALIAYQNSFSGPFIYDDSAAIRDNPTIQHLWPIRTVFSPPPGTTVSGRPIVNLSLAINYALGGTNAWGYHVLNLVIHILATFTLFGIVRRTLLGPVLHQRFGASASLLALTMAAIWMVHPLQTESVTYIIQRAESLVGLFYLMTLYCFIRGTELAGFSVQSSAFSVDAGLRSLTSRVSVLRGLGEGGWFTASVFFCLLGMASKEVMVSAPLIVMLYDRTFVAGSFREAWQKRRAFYLGLAATWLLLGYLVASTGGNRNGSAGFDGSVSWWTYALTQLDAIAHYLQLSLWPHPLIFDYGTAVVKQAGEVIPAALVIVALATGTVIGLRRWPAIGFVGVWFFAILAPSSSIVPVVTETMAEHRMYLPLAAVVALIVLGTYAWAGRKGTAVLITMAVLLGFLTVRRNEDYRSALSIWSDTAAKRPENARAHNQFGYALFEAGLRTEALQHYEEALRLKPADADGHYNLATALSRMGHGPEALGEFEETLRLKPDYAAAHDNYGLALMQADQTSKAITHYKEALQLKPGSAPTHNNLGIAFAQIDRMSEAMVQFKEALRLNPDYAEAHNNLGNAYRQMGRSKEALAQFEEALRINSDYAEAHNNLAILLDKSARTTEAIAHYKEVLRLEPGYAEAHYNLGNALASLVQVPEAIAQWEETLRLKPDHAQARDKLAQLRGGRAIIPNRPY